jgi:TonB family protein
MMLRVLLAVVVTLVFISALHAQSVTPMEQQPPLRAIYTPKPTYRSEWARQGLTGKGVVLVTVDKQTGKVTGARMLTSTGSKLLDGAALEAYSQWRFQPGTVSQVKIPIEFTNRQKPQATRRSLPQPVTLLIFLAVAGAAIAILKRRKG